MDLDTIKQHYITLLFTFFITLNAFSQVEGQSFCDGLEEGEYFPLNIVKKKVYWYNTYYFETKEGTKIIDGKKYNVFNQRWEDGSSDTILFREDSGGVYQYTENGDILIVGLNADSSVKEIKGKDRPINDQNSRAIVLAALSFVDKVVIFSEPTPIELINFIKPDVLVKGGDYKIEEIVGSNEVIGWGGKVVINNIVDGFSTTSIINKIQKPS